jgi:hypothetical protein
MTLFVKTKLKFDNPMHRNYELSIIDIYGDNVYCRRNIHENIIELHKGDLKPGAYFVRLSGEKTVVRKIIVLCL